MTRPYPFEKSPAPDEQPFHYFDQPDIRARRETDQKLDSIYDAYEMAQMHVTDNPGDESFSAVVDALTDYLEDYCVEHHIDAYQLPEPPRLES